MRMRLLRSRWLVLCLLAVNVFAGVENDHEFERFGEEFINWRDSYNTRMSWLVTQISSC